MRAVLGFVLLAGALLGAVGCASRADLDKVKREQDKMRPALADTQAAVDALRRQVDALRTDIQDRATGGGRSAGSAALADHERRLKSLEAVFVAAQQASPSPVVGEPVGVPPPQPQVDAVSVAVAGTAAASIAMRTDAALALSGPGSDAFRSALELYRQGTWDRAIAKFRESAQAAPKSDFADNAQYWVGESYFNQRDYNRAIIEFNDVLLKYPKGDRVPGALLALATAFADSGDKIDARLILQKLISDYPTSEETKVGRQKLQAVSE